MRVSSDPRGRFCEDDDEEAAEEEAGRRSRSPDSPRTPIVIGPWLKMAIDFAARGDPDSSLNDIEVRATFPQRHSYFSLAPLPT